MKSIRADLDINAKIREIINYMKSLIKTLENKFHIILIIIKDLKSITEVLIYASVILFIFEIFLF